MMKNRMYLFCVAAAVLALPLTFVGCDKEVSHSGSVKIDSDGSSKSQETTVTKSPGGTVTREETSKTVDSDGDSSSKTKTTVRAPDGTVIKEESTRTTTP